MLPPRPIQRRPGRLPGLLLAALALVSQIALGALVLPDEASAREQSAAALDALSILCDGSAPVTPDQVPRQHRHQPDCALCPFADSLAMPAAIPASGPDLPLPSLGVTGRTELPPPARGPPARPRPTPPSRGPPALS